MKKILLILLITVIGCVREDYSDFSTINLNPLGNLVITDITGLKFEGSNITDNVFKFYTQALQDGDYTIIISKDGSELHNVKLVIK